MEKKVWNKLNEKLSSSMFNIKFHALFNYLLLLSYAVDVVEIETNSIFNVEIEKLKINGSKSE